MPKSILGSLCLGIIAGQAFLWSLVPVSVIALVLTVGLSRITHAPISMMAAWGASYTVAASFWVLAPLSGLEVLFGAAGLIAFGGFGYGLTGLALRLPLPWVFWPIAVGAVEFGFASVGYSLAPIGLWAVETPVGHVIKLGSIYYASAGLSLLSWALANSGWGLRTAVAGVVLPWLLLLPGPELPPTPIRVVGVSVNPDPVEKWTAAGSRALLEQLVEATSEIGEADLIVWPENSVTTTFDLERAVGQVGSWDVSLLFGMNRYLREGSPDLINSAVLVEAGEASVTDKLILAPIYEAGARWFKVPSVFPGARRVLQLRSGRRILVLICYEAAFTIPKEDQHDVDLLIVISADSGFQKRFVKTVMDDHLKARALEAGLPAIRIGDLSASQNGRESRN